MSSLSGTTPRERLRIFAGNNREENVTDLLMVPTRGRKGLVTWHIDPEFGRVIPSAGSPIGLPSGAKGSWGESKARNFLAAKGVYTVKHAVFRLASGRLISDLFDTTTLTAYELKTGRTSTLPYFRTRLAMYRETLDEGLAKKVVYVHVGLDGCSGFTESQQRAIKRFGFEVLEVEG